MLVFDVLRTPLEHFFYEKEILARHRKKWKEIKSEWYLFVPEWCVRTATLFKIHFLSCSKFLKSTAEDRLCPIETNFNQHINPNAKP